MYKPEQKDSEDDNDVCEERRSDVEEKLDDADNCRVEPEVVE